MGFSGVVVVDAAVREVFVTNSGSSEASREEGIESDREWGACITYHISMWTQGQW